MVAMVHILVSSPNTSRCILRMPTLRVDLCICSTAMMDGGLISLIGYSLTRLDIFSMLQMNTPLVDAIATEIMARACAVRGIKIVLIVQVLREAASWIQMNSPCAATQRSIWDGVTERNSHQILDLNSPSFVCILIVQH